MVKDSFAKLMKNSEALLLYGVIILALILILVQFFSNTDFYVWSALFVLLYMIFYVIFGIVYLIYSLNSMLKEEPFNFFSIVLMFAFIFLPILFLNSKNYDSINTFYTLAISIGVNYIIDGNILLVRIDEKHKKKELLDKKSAKTKILFNSIYIAECTSFILIKNWSSFIDVNKLTCTKFGNSLVEMLSKIPKWIPFIFLSMFIFLILIISSLTIQKAVQKELNIESNNGLNSPNDEETDIIPKIPKSTKMFKKRKRKKPTHIVRYVKKNDSRCNFFNF